MQQVNFHQQKLYSLIVGALALIAMFLPWTVQKLPGFDIFGQGIGGGSVTMNGFRSVGFLSLIGILGVVLACFMGDKTKPFDAQSKMIAMGSFGAIAGGALIYFILVSTKNKAYGASGGIGIWIALIAGLAGLAWVSGMIKMQPAKPSSPTPPPPPSS